MYFHTTHFSCSLRIAHTSLFRYSVEQVEVIQSDNSRSYFPVSSIINIKFLKDYSWA